MEIKNLKKGDCIWKIELEKGVISYRYLSRFTDNKSYHIILMHGIFPERIGKKDLEKCYPAYGEARNAYIELLKDQIKIWEEI